MPLQWMIFVSLYTLTKCEDQYIMLSKTHSTRLEKYYGYADSTILHFKVPADTNFVSFVFEAEEVVSSLFRCKPQDVTVYLKQGSPPVVNPDSSKFPKGFSNIRRPEIYKLEFLSNNEKNYINISSPFSGSYFAAAFISYTNPKHDGITQEGLTPDCLTFLNAALWVKQKPTPYLVVSDRNTHLLVQPNIHRLYKFYVPEVADSAVLSIQKIEFCYNCTELVVRIQPNTIPDPNSTLHEITLKRENYNLKTYFFRFVVLENSWYYIDFFFKDTSNNTTLTDDTAQFIFKVKFFLSFINITRYNVSQPSRIEIRSEPLTDKRIPTLYKIRNNNSIPFKHAVLNDYYSSDLYHNIPYKQYDLIRDGRTESFMYSFDLQPSVNGVTPLAINVTNNDVFVLKFHVNPGLDIGGTLQLDLTFKPRIKTLGKRKLLVEEPKNHTIVACIRNGAKEIPTWPNKCVYNRKQTIAPIVLNKSADSNMIYLPYPEPGDWYISFRLFCGNCEECNCSNTCKNEYRICLQQCESYCENFEQCNLCFDECDQLLVNETECTNCDCDGPCKRSDSYCSSSVMFAVASYPCVGGKCGSNGKCMYMVSEGLAYSLCVCTNNYRGWDCSDDSEANSNGMIILELLLLVLSNLLFLPAVYISYKRGFYVEAIVYFSTCFFSTFYHACDAGENIYSFCLVRLAVLQFSDFFSGLLSIWVTVIAMAYLPNSWPSICHIGGAIVLAFGTTVNKTSLWVFALPFLTGILILIISWYIRYRKMGMLFPSKRYLFIIFPSGLIIVGVGLLMYALLQTQSNYKYLHSLWHMLMAFSIMLLLPDKKTFLPPAIQPID